MKTGEQHVLAGGAAVAEACVEDDLGHVAVPGATLLQAAAARPISAVLRSTDAPANARGWQPRIYRGVAASHGPKPGVSELQVAAGEALGAMS